MSRWKPSDDPINQHIVKRVKQRRKALNVSQSTLAQALDVSYQQMQKYENGQNSISAAKLYVISHELGVPVNWFFEEL